MSTPEPESPPQAERPGFYARSEARNQAVRDELTPIAPGERPPALLATIAFFVLFALANGLALALADDPDPNEVPIGIGLVVVLLVLAGGLWLKVTAMVLAAQAVLGLTVAISALSAIAFSNVGGLLLSLATFLLSGFLFVRMVRVLSRLQMPRAVPSDGHG